MKLKQIAFISLLVCFALSFNTVKGQDNKVGIYKTYEDYVQDNLTDAGMWRATKYNAVTFKKDGVKTKYVKATCWGARAGHKFEHYRFLPDNLLCKIIVHSKNEKQIGWYATWTTRITRDENGDIRSMEITTSYITKGGEAETFEPITKDRLVHMMSDMPELAEAFKNAEGSLISNAYSYISAYNKAME